MTANQIDMSLVGVIELRYDVGELSKDFVMPGHVCRKNTSDDPFAHGSISGIVQRREYIALGRFQYPKRHGAMMILKGRNVVVTQCQLGTSIDLIDVIVTRMI